MFADRVFAAPKCPTTQRRVGTCDTLYGETHDRGATPIPPGLRSGRPFARPSVHSLARVDTAQPSTPHYASSQGIRLRFIFTPHSSRPSAAPAPRQQLYLHSTAPAACTNMFILCRKQMGMREDGRQSRCKADLLSLLTCIYLRFYVRLTRPIRRAYLTRI
jgi:hypothetical protein